MIDGWDVGRPSKLTLRRERLDRCQVSPVSRYRPLPSWTIVKSCQVGVARALSAAFSSRAVVNFDHIPAQGTESMGA